jgi:DNA polymerase III gamma/tau subunit
MLSTEVVPGFLSLGQAAARAAALRSSQRGRMGRTFLVAGPRGGGKGAFVDDLLALLLCTDADRSARPCNACSGCRQARARSHPDLVLGSPDRWRELRSSGESIVAAARRWLATGAGAPVAGERRVILIEGVDRSGEQIQNMLLKALEEPSDRHVYVLVAEDPSLLLPTIRSRSQLLRIGPVPRAELTEWLMDAWRLPRDQADALARISGGLSGRAAALAREPDRVAWRRRIQVELLSLLERGRADRFTSARELLDEATRRAAPALDAEPVEPAVPSSEVDAEPVRTPTSQQRLGALAVIEAWVELARDLLVASVGRSDVAPSSELLPDLAAVGVRIDTGAMARMVDLLERIHEGLEQNAAPRLALEVAMLAWPTVSSS